MNGSSRKACGVNVDKTERKNISGYISNKLIDRTVYRIFK